MQVEESEVLVFSVRMQHYLLDCVYRTVLTWRRVDVAAIEVDSVGVDSEVSSRNTVGVEDREYVEDEGVPQQLAQFCVSGELVDDTSHHMRARHFTWMHSRADHYYFLLALELPRFLTINKQQSIIEALLPLSNALY